MAGIEGTTMVYAKTIPANDTHFDGATSLELQAGVEKSYYRCWHPDCEGVELRDEGVHHPHHRFMLHIVNKPKQERTTMAATTAFEIGDRVRVKDNGCVLHGEEVTITGIANENYYEFKTDNGNSCTESGDSLELISRKGSFMGTLVEKVKFLALSKEDRALRKQGVVDGNGKLTSDGRELLEEILVNAYKKELVEAATEIEAYDKAEKKDK